MLLWIEKKFFIKKIVLHDPFKVSKGFKHFLNFSKFSYGPPFASASDACGPPLWFWLKLSKSLKTCSYGSKLIFFIEKIVLHDSFNVWKGFKHFLIFWNFHVVPPLLVQVTSVVPPLVLGQNL